MLIDIGAIFVVVLVTIFMVVPAIGSNDSCGGYRELIRVGWLRLITTIVACSIGAIILTISYLFVLSLIHVFKMAEIL